VLIVILLSPWVRFLIYWGAAAGTDLLWQLYQGLTREQNVPPTELRRAMLVFDHPTAPLMGEDARITTIDFLNVTDGAPDSSWTAADYNNVNARITTFWNEIKPYYSEKTRLREIRYYAIGPEIERSGPPRHVHVLNSLGGHTGAGSTPLPPQVAVTVTERTQSPGRWGRLYLPAPSVGQCQDGYLQAGPQGAIATAYANLVNAHGEEEIVPVVTSKAKPARTTKKGSTLPAQPWAAMSISRVQVDNIFDVMRSRRYREGITREIRQP
jgi:hypothetical protein